MRIQRGLLDWGFFFIVLGTVPLAVQQGWITLDQIGSAWRFWPLILVGIGVALLLRRTPAETLGGLIVAGTFGFIFGALIAGGWSFGMAGACSAGSGQPETIYGDSGVFEGQGARAEIDFDCGDLRVVTASGRGWSLQAGDASDRAPRVEHDAGSLRIRTADDRDVPFVTGVRRDWTVTLPTETALSLQLTATGARGEIDLSGAQVNRLQATFNGWDGDVDLTAATVGGPQFSYPALELTYNAGSSTIRLPERSTFHGVIQANAGSIDLCLPEGVGLSAAVEGTAISTNFAGSGFVGSGGSYQNPAYANATYRIDLEIHGNAASFTLNPEGGCR